MIFALNYNDKTLFSNVMKLLVVFGADKKSAGKFSQQVTNSEVIAYSFLLTSSAD